MSATVVDSVESVCRLIEDIEKSSPHPPFLFIDLEGVNISRHGSVAILQILLPSAGTVHLVDVHKLKKQAFETRSSNGLSLKDVLESETLPKVFFDVRNDSDALYSHFQVKLRCVVDLQLLEFATRPSQGRFLKGLAKCISEDAGLSWKELREAEKVKESGLRLFAPEKGGSYEVFHERPIPPAIIDYCVQDVTVMPKLLLGYARQLSNQLASQVHSETLARISLSQSPSFNGKGRHMAVGPTFSWHRVAGLSRLSFPMSVVCSGDVAEYCVMGSVEAVAPAQENQNNASVSSTLPSPQTGPEDSIASALGALQISETLTGSRRVYDEDEDDENDCEPFEYRIFGGAGSRSSSPSDYAACSKDDCGYCGHCSY